MTWMESVSIWNFADLSEVNVDTDIPSVPIILNILQHGDILLRKTMFFSTSDYHIFVHSTWSLVLFIWLDQEICDCFIIRTILTFNLVNYECWMLNWYQLHYGPIPRHVSCCRHEGLPPECPVSPCVPSPVPRELPTHVIQHRESLLLLHLAIST